MKDNLAKKNCEIMLKSIKNMADFFCEIKKQKQMLLFRQKLQQH